MDTKDKFVKISDEKRKELISRMTMGSNDSLKGRGRKSNTKRINIPDSVCDFGELPGYKELIMHHTIASQAGIIEPFFQKHEGIPRAMTRIEGRDCLNFSTYDYLGLNGTDRINQSAFAAMELYGTTASASRLVSGERPIHSELESNLANFLGMEDCITYVSGHATNVWAIAQLVNSRDLILYDALSHNSIVHGAKTSGAHRLAYPHNDYDALDKLLQENREKYKRTLIVTEGLFSMDGDIPDLPRLLELKKKYKCFLMVDEAHSLGVLGEKGKGVAEYYGVDPNEIDILMGTLSKTLCGCGGYIASKKEFVELLKYSSPGFVYSVGMSPALAAASLEALNILIEEPERVARIKALSQHFLKEADRLGLDTGKSQGYVVLPVMVGSSLVAGKLATVLHERGLNISPIIYPAVEDSLARLRFFITHWHTEQQITEALNLLAEELPLVQKMMAALAAG